ncbi:hypothetical protein [Methanobacterium sp. ACI-7]|uniref:hypothetical protein n=1 Tax=unclassified Methanobacterium TaxID=2627676 RepID=UPI0039C1F206
MKQFLITPAAGKRLIAKALAEHYAIKEVLKKGTLVIIAGTTNGYIAEEILSTLNQADDFSRDRFFRGIVLPPCRPVTSSGRIKNESKFPGDVIIKDGIWEKKKTIFDVVDDLNEGDIILKGVNALNYPKMQTGIYIGDPKGGTIGAAIQAVVGRRVKLMLPAGLEKRIYGDLNDLALKLNVPGSQGPRLLPVAGEIITEIEAISILTGAKAEQVAGGGVSGAEGSIWLAVSGNEEEIKSTQKLINSVSSEKQFEF